MDSKKIKTALAFAIVMVTLAVTNNGCNAEVEQNKYSSNGYGGSSGSSTVVSVTGIH